MHMQTSLISLSSLSGSKIYDAVFAPSFIYTDGNLLENYVLCENNLAGSLKGCQFIDFYAINWDCDL